MDVIQEILRLHGYGDVDEMEVGESIKVHVPAYMDLSIEKIGVDRLSVAHYYTQRGDLMSDPEVVFRTDGQEWTPVRFTQHPGVHQYDEEGLPEIEGFLHTWEKNLERQGFVDGAKKTV